MKILKLNTVQRAILKNLLSKILLFPAIWFFVWAIYPLATSPYLLQGFDILFYLMLSLKNWLLFLVSLLGAVVIEMLIANPELRRSLMHIERGAHPSVSSGDKSQSKKKEEKMPLY